MLSVIKQALLEVKEVPVMITNSKTDIRLSKIYEFLETHKYIMNNDVQKLLLASFFKPSSRGEGGIFAKNDG